MEKIPDIIVQWFRNRFQFIADDEEWKSVPDYEDLYLISNYGRIFSFWSARVLRLNTNVDGYHTINVSRGNRGSFIPISRLVGKLFVAGHFEGAQINHKDLNKKNNCYKNLEWVTPKENTRHAFANRKIGRRGTVTTKHLKAMREKRKPVYAYNIETKETLHFDSNKSCGEFFGVKRGTVGSTFCHGSKLRGKYLLFREKEFQQFKTENNL